MNTRRRQGCLRGLCLSLIRRRSFVEHAFVHDPEISGVIEEGDSNPPSVMGGPAHSSSSSHRESYEKKLRGREERERESNDQAGIGRERFGQSSEDEDDDYQSPIPSPQ